MKRINYRSLIITTALLSCVFFPGYLFADGGGVFSVNPFPQELLGDIDVDNLSLNYRGIGGYGYGTNREGNRIGGFGFAFIPEEPGKEYEGSLAGGIGGLYFGREILGIGPVTVSFNGLFGTGGVALDHGTTSSASFAVLGQGVVEVGFAPLSFLEISAYAGMQLLYGPSLPYAMGAFEGFIYGPVAGLRLTWGSFNSL